MDLSWNTWSLLQKYFFWNRVRMLPSLYLCLYVFAHILPLMAWVHLLVFFVLFIDCLVNSTFKDL